MLQRKTRCRSGRFSSLLLLLFRILLHIRFILFTFNSYIFLLFFLQLEKLIWFLEKQGRHLAKCRERWAGALMEIDGVVRVW